MSFSFTAADDEFVTSTGPNARAGGLSTRFDGPPDRSSGLVITPKTGDPDPRLFELGDTYDIRWKEAHIQDAVVIRSNSGGDTAGIVGFEGTDQNGDPAYVLWTPDFDLQSWYIAATRGGGEASFFTSDCQPSHSHSRVCFAAEVRIETPYGLMPVGCLKPGHRVNTRDHGPRVIRWVGQQRVMGLGGATPVHFETHAIGNTAPLRLSQHHRVMISSPQAELLFGCAEVLVPAFALVGLSGVSLAPCVAVTYVQLLLDRHEVLLADGAPCESLFIGPLAGPGIGSDLGLLPDGHESAIRHPQTARPVLTFWEARLLLDLPVGAKDAVVQCM